MSMQEYEDAKELVTELLIILRGVSTFIGPRPETLINLAQDRLSVNFLIHTVDFCLSMELVAWAGLNSMELFKKSLNNLVIQMLFGSPSKGVKNGTYHVSCYQSMT